VKNDQRVVVAFFKKWKNANERDGGFSHYVIIEKTTGTLIELDDNVMSVMGETYKDVAEPRVDVGHCELTRP
jgi:hypothetical protein